MSAEWLHWYYLIYLLPAAVAVLVLLMTGLGGQHGGHSHAASTHSVGAPGLHLHAHHAGGAAVHAGHAAAGAPTGHGHAGPHAAGHGPGGHGSHPSHPPSPAVGRQLLGFFGVGRAPITLLVGSLMIGWGLFGLGATELLRPLLRFPALFVAPSLAIAAVGSLLTAKLFGELTARVMPQDETCSITREGLLGLTGKVVYPVSGTSGRVHLYDQYRTLHVEPARVLPGQAPIEKGTEVIVASMDPDRGYLLVEPLGFTSGVARHETRLENAKRLRGSPPSEGSKPVELKVNEGQNSDG